MRISNSLKNSLDKIFQTNIYVQHNHYNLTRAGASLVSCRIGDGMFIPAADADNRVHRALHYHPHVDNIVLPLVSANNIYTDKTATAIFNEVVKNMSFRASNCITINTTKGYKYNGGKGFILTEDFVPLIICGYKAVIEEIIPVFEYPVCIINPKVFTRDDIVSLSIVKQVIPYYSGHSVNTDPRGVNAPKSGEIRIIITPDIDKFVSSPVAPDNYNVDSEMYSILESHMSSVTNV